MKIALAQLNYTVGDIQANQEKITKAIYEAKEKGIDLIVFAELAICGYPPLDLLTFPHFISDCLSAINAIALHCTGISAIVGGPSINNAPRGKRLFNTAFVLQNGAISASRHKSLLPDYDVFDEYRYFETASEIEPIELNGKKIALTICEDLWEVGEPSLYAVQPMELAIMQQADFIINIAASPFHHSKAKQRASMAKQNAKRYNKAIYYVNQVGANTDLIFDGGSFYADAQGEICTQLPFFKEAVQEINTQAVCAVNPFSKIELVHQALILGIRDFFKKSTFQKALLGLSGGIDSALVAALAVEALGAENVTGVLMPSEFSSEHSLTDAHQLATKLNCKTYTISIAEANKSMLQTLDEPFKNTAFGLAEENIQARLRGLILMAISNKQGGIVLNTTNKSEAAVGYGTLYGDMCGGLGVLGDLYKTEAYALANYINRKEEIIPYNTINKAPSAELRPDQKDADNLPEYPILDAILLAYIEEQKNAQAIIALGFDTELVNRVIKLVNLNEYKRYQASPYLKLCPKSFGLGRKMPLVAHYSI